MARRPRDIIEAMPRHPRNATNDDMPNAIVLSLTNASRRDLFSMIMAASAPYCSDNDDDDDDDDDALVMSSPINVHLRLISGLLRASDMT